MMHTLFIVGTPIGNLGDLSPRARDCLSTADLVIAEDTRVLGRLCHLVGIAPRALRSYQGRLRLTATEFLGFLDVGDVALVSDAGMPGVSDPGAEFVKLALEHGAHVSAIPGASVLSVALALWPKPIHTACFYGFLPRRGSERAGMIAQVMRASSVGVILESPKRLFETCRELASVDGDRKVLLLGELTKLHESIRFVSLDEAVAVLEGVELKGEWAMAIDRSPQQRPSAMEGEQLLKALARSTLGTKEASEIYAEVHQIPARRAYEQMLARRSEGPAAG